MGADKTTSADRLPPPYESLSGREDVCGPACSSDINYTVVTIERDYLNEATPIGPYHRPLQDFADEVDDLLVPAGDLPEDGNGSTETIPSLWEPANHLTLEGADHSVTVPLFGDYNLVRSVSLNLPNGRRIVPLSSTRSDPCLPTGMDGRRRVPGATGCYADHHIDLSTYRPPSEVSTGTLIKFYNP